MMDCTQYKRAILADPHSSDPQLAEHRASCAASAQYSARLEIFEERLGRAARVAMPERGTRVGPRARAAPRAWLALAASVVLVVAVAGALWLAVPGPSLAADVVTHMAGEPQAWLRTDTAVPALQLDAVLQQSHLRLGASAGMVSYANSCVFRGHRVPHLVVQTDAGPVTVMVLRHESVASAMHFDEQGYRGVIVPAGGHGSLAVLVRGQGADPAFVAGVAARVLGAIQWTG
jgi:hypothetical protein